MTLSAHFDGKVIVPDEPLDLAPNQALTVQIHTVEGSVEMVVHTVEESALAWIAAKATDCPTQPVDMADQHDHYLYGQPPV
jgi:hypothetical protein